MAERVTPPIRVLVADDVTDTRDMYAQYLRDGCGMDVRTAVDGETAVQIAREWLPEVIVMDLSMPRLTGDEATRLLKQNPKTKHVAVLLLTAYGDYGRKTAETCGADQFREKPCNPQDLATIIQSLALARRVPRKKPTPRRPPRGRSMRRRGGA